MKLRKILPKKSGRSASGRIAVRHQGGRPKRYLRPVDFKRDKLNLAGQVVAVEYDPNRTANLALVHYPDGEKRYILCPEGLKVGDEIVSGEKVEIKAGNALPLSSIPVGTLVHNVELHSGRGGQIVRSAGNAALIVARENSYIHLKMPSGELRKISSNCRATVGQVSNQNLKNMVIGKAGRKRHFGIRPTVRGVAQNPRSHPHGGGEGRSGIGMPSPKSPWGKQTLGKRTRKKKKYSNQFILTRRK